MVVLRKCHEDVMENNEAENKSQVSPTLAEDIAFEFGHLFPTLERPLVDTSWANVERPLQTHYFSAKG